jgi:hypothetical protein
MSSPNSAPGRPAQSFEQQLDGAYVETQVRLEQRINGGALDNPVLSEHEQYFGAAVLNWLGGGEVEVDTAVRAIKFNTLACQLCGENSAGVYEPKDLAATDWQEARTFVDDLKGRYEQFEYDNPATERLLERFSFELDPTDEHVNFGLAVGKFAFAAAAVNDEANQLRSGDYSSEIDEMAASQEIDKLEAMWRAPAVEPPQV